MCAWYTDVNTSTIEKGALVPCDDVTCQGQTVFQGHEVSRACDVTGSACVCSRGFVLQGDQCVGKSMYRFTSRSVMGISLNGSLMLNRLNPWPILVMETRPKC